MKTLLRTLIITCFLFLLLGTVVASAFTIDLTYPNEPGMPTITYATVVGTVVGDHTFHFEIELASGLETFLNGGQNFGLDQFFFNTNFDATTLTLTNFGPETWSIEYNKNADGFGQFDVKMTNPTRNDRDNYLYFDITSLETLTEDNFFLLSDDPAGNGQGHFALHIAGFSYNGIGSIYVRDAVVPEPATILLFGAGLVGVGLLRKRFKK